LAAQARCRHKTKRRKKNLACAQEIDHAPERRLRHRRRQIERGDEPARCGDVAAEAFRDRHQRRRQHGGIDRIEHRAQHERRDECEAEG
jgi:hypothetical protein